MGRVYYCASCMNSFTQDVGTCPNLACGLPRPDNGWGLLLGEGDLLDRHYQVTRVLAIGGAGITYLAREVDDDGAAMPPDLAIKVLFNQRDSGPFLRRLANEAQILQELAHDHIVHCHGFVNRRGREPYLLTQFEPGGSLYDHVKRVGPLGPEVAGEVLVQILSALDVAHRRGVIHRDLKPQNVFLRAVVGLAEVPHCLVADFGIAKVSGALNAGLTQVGTFVGTPEFAAPEQFKGLPPEPGTDVFAAGALLFYILTGGPAVRFTQRRDIVTSLRELLDQTPPQLPADRADPRLQVVINGMMRPAINDRWSAERVLEALMSPDMPALDPPPASSPHAPAPRPHAPTPLHQATPLAPPQANAAGHTMIPGADGDLASLEPAPPEVIERLGQPARQVARPAPGPRGFAPPAGLAPMPVTPERTRIPLHHTHHGAAPPAPAPPPASGNELSLDDLFGSAPSMSSMVEASGNNLSLDDLLGGPPPVPPPEPHPAPRPPPAPPNPSPHPSSTPGIHPPSKPCPSSSPTTPPACSG